MEMLPELIRANENYNLVHNYLYAGVCAYLTHLIVYKYSLVEMFDVCIDMFGDKSMMVPIDAMRRMRYMYNRMCRRYGVRKSGTFDYMADAVYTDNCTIINIIYKRYDHSLDVNINDIYNPGTCSLRTYDVLHRSLLDIEDEYVRIPVVYSPSSVFRPYRGICYPSDIYVITQS